MTPRARIAAGVIELVKLLACVVLLSAVLPADDREAFETPKGRARRWT